MRRIKIGSDVRVDDKNKSGYKLLKYFIIESPVGFGYCNLKSYGIQIIRTDKKPGVPDMNECKVIEGIFFDMKEATDFVNYIKKLSVQPLELTVYLEKYIKCKLKRRREMLKCENI